jgi:hypothetical protein
VAIADLDEDFGLEELIDQPWYYGLLVRKRALEKLHTTVELSICKQFDEVVAVSRLDVVACANDQHCKIFVALNYLANDEQHRET